MSEQRYSLTPYGQRLVETNMKLAYRFAARLRRPRWLSAEEWCSEMLAALCKSVALYNGCLGIALSTYVCRGMVMHAADVYKKKMRRLGNKRVEKMLFADSQEFDRACHRTVDPAEEVALRDSVAWLSARIAQVRHGDVILETTLGCKERREIADDRGLSLERIRQVLYDACGRVRASKSCMRAASDWLIAS
jgi:hypothetical protein